MNPVKAIKPAVFSALAILLFFLALEAVLAVTAPLYTPSAESAVEARAPQHPAGKRDFFELVDEQYFADTHVINFNEIGIGVPDNDLIFRVRPNPGGRPVEHWTGTYESINTLGFRGPDFAFPSEQRSSTNIMLLGDSCGFGWSLHRYADTFPAILSEKLSSAGRYRLYNLSQPGYSSHQARLLFDKWFDRIQPDILIIYFGWNDIWNTPLLTDRQTIRLLSITNSPLIKALSATNIFQFLQFSARKVFKQAATTQENPPGYEATGRVRVPFAETLENIDAIVERTTATGGKVYIIAPPFSHDMYDRHYYMADMNQALYNAFSGRAYFLRLAPMRHLNPLSQRYFIDDGFHPNRYGSDLIADELFATIKAEPSPSAQRPFPAKGKIVIAARAPKIVGEEADDPTAHNPLGKVRIARMGKTENGALVYGPYMRADVGKGHARFRIKVDRPGNVPVVTLDIMRGVGMKALISRTLTGDDLAPNQWTEITLPFTIDTSSEPKLEARIFYHGGATVSVDSISIMPATRDLMREHGIDRRAAARQRP